MVSLSARIVPLRNNNIIDEKNCIQFYRDLKAFRKDKRMLAVQEFNYAFSRDLVSYSGQIIRNENTKDHTFAAFKERLDRIFEKLKETNDSHSERPGVHRLYENVINQQRLCMLTSQVYIKPADLTTQTPIQQRPCQFHQIIREITSPFLFESHFIQNPQMIVRFWETGDSMPVARGYEAASMYYRYPTTTHLKTLCLVFVATERTSPYISSIYLCERIVDRTRNQGKSEFQKMVVPIVHIGWNSALYGFGTY